MVRFASVAVVLLVAAILGVALYGEQQDATIDCVPQGPGLYVIRVGGGTAREQLGRGLSEQWVRSCDRERAAKASQDRLELAAVAGAAVLLAGWLSLRRRRGDSTGST